MEDQGKRLIVAVALCFLILWVTTALFAPKKDSQPASAPQVAHVVAPATQPTTPVAPAALKKERGPEQRLVLTTPHYQATFSSYGGGLASFVLAGAQYHPLDLVRTGDNPEWYPLALSMPESTFAVDPQSEWMLEKKSDTEIVARWSSSDLEVVKSYRLHPDTYVIDLGVEVTNRSSRAADQRLGVSLFGYQDPQAPTERSIWKYVPPPWQTSCFSDGERHTEMPSLKGPKTFIGDVRWAGLDHKYFLLAVAPKPERGVQYSCSALAVPERAGVMEMSVVFPAWKLQPGDTIIRNMTVYVGPKLLDHLEDATRLAGYETQFPAAVDWGGAPLKWFTVIARPMLSLLKMFQRVTGNWGVAIILLTLTVKLLTLYWTQKSMRNMKAMGKLKPKLDEIRVKWPDDKQRQNVEVMNLYKTHNINPLGGCLPMLLQMPVWMALYSSLNAAAELYRAPFFGWIHDLTAPDRFYVLPILVTGLMFVQAKIQPAAVDSAQQKMMQYMMPIMFGVFSLVFPAGLSVYIFTNTLLGMAHQVYMNKTQTA